MIAAIIFDCDGVLVDSEVLAIEVETTMLAELGLRYEPAVFRTRFMGMSNKAFFSALDVDCRAQLGHPLPPEFPQRCHDRVQREIDTRIAEIVGARETIAKLSKAKAVASSSTSSQLDIKLRLTGLRELFAPHIYSADHVTHAKPAPDLFLHAARELGVAPAHCLVVEDSVNGILAARAARMHVWGFAGGGHMDEMASHRLSEAGAERIVPTWADAASLFAAL